MDRQIIYGGQVPQTTDLLNTNKAVMIALAKLAADMLGTATLVSGLGCVPTAPASMSVNVNPGQIYQLVTVDGTAYSAIALDTTHSIMKQGILMDAQSFALTAPATGGYSQNYLLQATFQESDINNTVLPYYNSNNPQQAFSGPGGAGTSQPTTRAGQVTLQMVAGTAAATGSQTTPAVSAGYVGLAVITVANGQATITAANISVYPNAPVLPAAVLPAIQANSLVSGADTGAANACVLNLNPPVTVLADRMVAWFTAKATNTGATTLNLCGLGAQPLVGAAHSALQGGEIVANGKCVAIWNATINSWVLLECTGGALQIAPATQTQHATQAAQVQTGALITLTSVSGTNTITTALSPAPTAMPTSSRFRFQPVNINTGGATLQINGFSPHAITKLGQALQGGELSPLFLYDVVFDGTNYQLQNVAIPFFMTGTSNGNTEVDAVPNGTGTGSSFRAWGALSQTNCSYGATTLTATDFRIDSGIVGSGSYLPLTFYSNGSERGRFDTGGNFLIGKTVNMSTAVGVMGAAAGYLTVTANHGTTAIPVNVVSASGTENAMSFSYNSSVVGSISMTASATAFNTSSDYRLKENIVPLTGALARIAQIPVHRFNFKTDPTHTVDGFLAHEAQAVVPEAVTGAKDALRTAVNVVLSASGAIEAEGVTQGDFETAQSSYPAGSTWAASLSVPVYQAIDQSKLVPLLVAAVQELQAQVAALQTKVGA